MDATKGKLGLKGKKPKPKTSSSIDDVVKDLKVLIPTVGKLYGFDFDYLLNEEDINNYLDEIEPTVWENQYGEDWYYEKESVARDLKELANEATENWDGDNPTELVNKFLDMEKKGINLEYLHWILIRKWYNILIEADGELGSQYKILEDLVWVEPFNLYDNLGLDVRLKHKQKDVERVQALQLKTSWDTNSAFEEGELYHNLKQGLWDDKFIDFHTHKVYLPENSIKEILKKGDYKNIKLLIVSGHGEKTNIKLANGITLDMYDASLDDFVRLVGPRLTEDATILLDSCCVGQKGGFADALTEKLPNVKVISWNKPIPKYDIALERSGSGRFDFTVGGKQMRQSRFEVEDEEAKGIQALQQKQMSNNMSEAAVLFDPEDGGEQYYVDPKTRRVWEIDGEEVVDNKKELNYVLKQWDEKLKYPVFAGEIKELTEQIMAAREEGEDVLDIFINSYNNPNFREEETIPDFREEETIPDFREEETIPDFREEETRRQPPREDWETDDTDSSYGVAVIEVEIYGKTYLHDPASGELYTMDEEELGQMKDFVERKDLEARRLRQDMFDRILRRKQGMRRNREEREETRRVMERVREEEEREAIEEFNRNLEQTHELLSGDEGYDEGDEIEEFEYEGKEYWIAAEEVGVGPRIVVGIYNSKLKEIKKDKKWYEIADAWKKQDAETYVPSEEAQNYAALRGISDTIREHNEWKDEWNRKEQEEKDLWNKTFTQRLANLIVSVVELKETKPNKTAIKEAVNKIIDLGKEAYEKSPEKETTKKKVFVNGFFKDVYLGISNGVEPPEEYDIRTLDGKVNMLYKL